MSSFQLSHKRLHIIWSQSNLRYSFPAGLAIYIFYGIRHSVEGLSGEDDPDAGSTHGEYIVNESPTLSQKIKPVQPKQTKTEEKAPLKDSFQDTPTDETAAEAGNE